MQKRKLAGAVWATRYFMILSVAALCTMLVSHPAGAQAPAGQPTITIGDVTARACANEATLLVPYEAQADEGVGFVSVTAKQVDGDATFTSDLVIDSPTMTFVDVAFFTIPPETASGAWTITANVRDTKNQSGTSERTITVSPDTTCGDIDVSILQASLSGPVCPDPATLTVDYSANAAAGIDKIVITATSDADPEGLSDEIVSTNNGSSVVSSATFKVPATTPTSKWDVNITVFDVNGKTATDLATVELVANPGCEREGPTVELGDVSVETCPTRLLVPYTVKAAAGVGLISVEVTPPGGGSGFSAETVLDSTKTEFSDTAEFEIPVGTSAATWNVKVTGYDKNNDSASASTTFDFVPVPEECEASPSLTVENVSVSGPLCPNAAVLAAKVGVKNASGPVTIVGKVTGPDGYVLEARPVNVNAADKPISVPWVIEIPVDAPGGTMAVEVTATGKDGTGKDFTLIQRAEIEVKKDAKSCVADAGLSVKIDVLKVCPSTESVSVTASASANAGLTSLTLSSDLFDKEQSASFAAGERTTTQTFGFPIPKSAKAGTYQMMAKVVDAKGNASFDYRDFMLGTVDDCKVIDPDVVPTPTPGSGGGIIIPPPKPTPTPTVDDNKHPAPTPTPTPGNDDKTKKLAFTGRNSAATALGGVLLIATGVAVSYDTGSKRRRKR